MNDVKELIILIQGHFFLSFYVKMSLLLLFLVMHYLLIKNLRFLVVLLVPLVKDHTLANSHKLCFYVCWTLSNNLKHAPGI